METHARSMRHLVEESEAAGVDAELPRLFQAMADRAVAAGHGSEGYPAMVHQFRAGPATGTGEGTDADAGARLVAKYISTWNERDPRRRRALAAEVFTAHAEYVDPSVQAVGLRAIDDHIARWQTQFTEATFQFGEVHGHHNSVYFDWSFGLSGESPIGRGWDTVELEHGRIRRVFGFFASRTAG
ncbi:nuclear transport factor 2 family protein [Nocardia sp. NPDC051990]|uniref:nuclear transport factor 2 family protein n=1 Tax=Nocardia sp. NPDC051990 TaxID=3155285 RepID=UPI00341585F7